MTLDQILKNDEPQKVEVVEPPKVETPEVAKQERDDAGRFKGEAKAEKPEAEKPTPKEKVESATPAPKEEKVDEPAEVQGLKSAHMAEKKKRQEYERLNAAMQAELAQLKAGPAQAPPDVFTDPNGALERVRQEAQAEAINRHVNMSAAVAKRSYPDFDEVMAEWPSLMQQNPALYQQALQQELPAEWAYQQVKRIQFLREVGDDPSAYRTRVEQELRQKWEAEFRQPAPVRPEVPAPPPSLATATSAPVREQQWSGPRSLNAILKR